MELLYLVTVRQDKMQRMNIFFKFHAFLVFGFTGINFAVLQKNAMNWIVLIIAGLFEVAFAACLGKAREANGTEASIWYSGFLLSLILSMLLLTKATQTLPLGTAYAVWTGIGAVGTVLVGIFFFQEPVHFWRMFFLVTLIASLVGLKVVSH